MVEAGHHQEVHLREYLDILQSGGHRAQPSPTAVAREARPAPRCPEERQCWSADAGRRFGWFIAFVTIVLIARSCWHCLSKGNPCFR